MSMRAGPTRPIVLKVFRTVINSNFFMAMILSENQLRTTEEIPPTMNGSAESKPFQKTMHSLRSGHSCKYALHVKHTTLVKLQCCLQASLVICLKCSYRVAFGQYLDLINKCRMLLQSLILRQNHIFKSGFLYPTDSILLLTNLET